MMADCGCRYEPWLGTNYATHESVGGNIIYCPRHAAADEMYEKLFKAPLPPYKDGFTRRHEIAREQWFAKYTEWYRDIQAALALADGEKDGG